MRLILRDLSFRLALELQFLEGQFPNLLRIEDGSGHFLFLGLQDLLKRIARIHCFYPKRLLFLHCTLPLLILPLSELDDF